MSLAKFERLKRAQWWPVVIAHYFRALWQLRHKISPPLGFFETLKLANTHTHSWIWGNIEYDDFYLPSKKHQRYYSGREL